MKEVIECISKIEKEHNVSVIFACEASSRAWGFPSYDSDYDVRFVYIHNTNYYLSLDIDSTHKKDKVDIIRSVEGNIDLEGWDIKKFLTLLWASNPSTIDWVKSPIFYKNIKSFRLRAQRIINMKFIPERNMYKHIHISSDNINRYIKGDVIKIKKYFYILKSLLTIQWMESIKECPPVELPKLLTLLSPNHQVGRIIKDLISIKLNSPGDTEICRIAALDNYINEELVRIKNTNIPRPKENFDSSMADKLFIDMLGRSEGNNV